MFDLLVGFFFLSLVFNILFLIYKQVEFELFLWVDQIYGTEKGQQSIAAGIHSFIIRKKKSQVKFCLKHNVYYKQNQSLEYHDLEFHSKQFLLQHNKAAR